MGQWDHSGRGGEPLLRIGIYLTTKSSGVSRYAWNLLEHLLRADGENAYLAYTDGPGKLGYLKRRGNLTLRRFTIGDMREAWKQVQVDLPRLLRRDRLDLFHTQADCFPLGAPCRTVVTLHDIIPISSPNCIRPLSWQRHLSHQVRVAARLADQIIVPTRHVEREITQILKVAPERVTRIRWGCPPFFRPVPRDPARAAVRRRFRLRRPFLLVVGELSVQKNVSPLIRLFRSRLRDRCDLVLVGKRTWEEPGFQTLLSADRAVHWLGTAPDAELLQLYAAAECLVFPSMAEGFGFPPLEAMACGTPVVAMRATSVPEVVGSAALLVDPGSPAGLAEALERILEDSRLRQRLRRRGLERAARFRWEQTAAKTLGVYRRAAGGRGP